MHLIKPSFLCPLCKNLGNSKNIFCNLTQDTFFMQNQEDIYFIFRDFLMQFFFSKLSLSPNLYSRVFEGVDT